MSETLAENFTHNGVVLGVDGRRNSLKMLYAASPDVRVAIEDTAASGDKVVSRMTWTGTQTGAFLGHPPGGRAVNWTALSLIRVEGGRIAEAWVNRTILAS